MVSVGWTAKRAVVTRVNTPDDGKGVGNSRITGDRGTGNDKENYSKTQRNNGP